MSEVRRSTQGMVGGLTGDLFIQLTTTLAHLSNLTNHHLTGLGRTVSNESLTGEVISLL